MYIAKGVNVEDNLQKYPNIFHKIYNRSLDLIVTSYVLSIYTKVTFI